MSIKFEELRKVQNDQSIKSEERERNYTREVVINQIRKTCQAHEGVWILSKESWKAIYVFNIRK